MGQKQRRGGSKDAWSRALPRFPPSGLVAILCPGRTLRHHPIATAWSCGAGLHRPAPAFSAPRVETDSTLCLCLQEMAWRAGMVRRDFDNVRPNAAIGEGRVDAFLARPVQFLKGVFDDTSKRARASRGSARRCRRGSCRAHGPISTISASTTSGRVSPPSRLNSVVTRSVAASLATPRAGIGTGTGAARPIRRHRAAGH